MTDGLTAFFSWLGVALVTLFPIINPIKIRGLAP
jgi:hypothetical protein